MPQGQPIRVPTPPGILLFDPLSTDDGGLLPSTNNVVQRFGTLESRPGLQALGSLVAGELALGAFWIRDKAGTVEFFVGSDRRLYRYNNAARHFDDLRTGAAPALTGSIACPTTFTYFEQGNFQYALFVNGVDAAMEHQLGTNTYALVPTGYIARTICTVSNRVFYGNLTIGGVRFPTMVAWSAAGDRTVNPALARKLLIDTGDHVVAVRRGHRNDAFIYCEKGIWTATAKAASDANAFDFDIAWQGPGPVGPGAIGSDPGFRHMYLGNDLNLWIFDGTNASILAPTSQLFKGRFNPLFAAAVSVTYDAINQELLCSLPLDGDTIPQHEVRYSFVSKGVFPAQWNRLYPVTLLASWQIELETATCQLPDVPTCQLPDVPTCQLGFTAGQETVVIGASALVGTHAGSDDNGQPITADFDLFMPIQPGQAYEFNTVEIQSPRSCPPLAVSVKLGDTYDTCTHTIPLGTIDPSITPPPYGQGPLEDVSGGPNLCRLTSDDHMRGRCVILHVTSTSPLQMQMRRLELSTTTRRSLA
jgi:hypothetical protein